MNSALKPVSSPSPSVPSQHSKPLHPQGGGSTPTYGQPSGHMSQNPYPNLNVAHNHPNAAPQNHFPLNVPNSSSGHYMGAIPASNHPVANVGQSGNQQGYTAPKSASYSSGYQPNLGHPPNQNTLPPVTQSLPATQQSQAAQPPQQQQRPTTQAVSNSSTAPVSNTGTVAADKPQEKPQSNGTPEVKTPLKVVESNHVTAPAGDDKPQEPQVPPQPATQPQALEKPVEKPKQTPSALEPKPAPPPPPPSSQQKLEPAKVPKEPSPSPVPQTPETDPLAVEAPQEVTQQEPAENSAIPTPVDEPKPVEPDAEEIPDAKLEEPETDLSEATEESTESSSVPDTDKDSKESEQSSAGKSVSDCVVAEDVQVAGVSPAAKSKEQSAPKKESPPAKPAVTPRAPRKSKPPKPEDTPRPPKSDPKTPVQKSPGAGKAKRQRIMTQHYQSPLPEIEIITKISSSMPRNKSGEDKLIYFYKNEFLAVRNAEGGFYLCQAVQNVYKSSLKIKIRWLSQDKNDKTGEIYTPDFYDLTDFDCILTSLDLARVDKGRYRLTKAEKERTDSILKRCLAVEKGEILSPSLSEEHPDGLDLSLYKDEEQLKKKRKGTKRKAANSSTRAPKKEPATKKSPEVAKVRKVEVKSSRRAAPATTPAPRKALVPQKKTAQAEVAKKAPVASTRAGRGKRKSDVKTSPVVDQKKAKVLAKIGRKAAVPASTSRAQTSTAKSGRASHKATPPATKAAAPLGTTSSARVSTRKIKRSTRK